MSGLLQIVRLTRTGAHFFGSNLRQSGGQHGQALSSPKKAPPASKADDNYETRNQISEIINKSRGRTESRKSRSTFILRKTFSVAQLNIVT